MPVRASLGHEPICHPPILDTQRVAAVWMWGGGGAGMEREIRLRKLAGTRHGGLECHAKGLGFIP